MEENKSQWPYALRYGTMAGLISVVISLIFYFINPDAIEGKSSSGWIQSVLGILIIAAVFFIGTKTYRDEALEGQMTYGKSVLYSLAMGLPFAIIVGIFTFILFKFIDPDLLGKVVDKQAEEMAQQGKSDEEIEKTIQMMGYFNSATVYGIFGTLGMLLESLLIGLVISIFTQKTPSVTNEQ